MRERKSKGLFDSFIEKVLMFSSYKCTRGRRLGMTSAYSVVFVYKMGSFLHQQISRCLQFEDNMSHEYRLDASDLRR